jgi:hypothetical protein
MSVGVWLLCVHFVISVLFCDVLVACIRKAENPVDRGCHLGQAKMEKQVAWWNSFALCVSVYTEFFARYPPMEKFVLRFSFHLSLGIEGGAILGGIAKTKPRQ